MKAFDETPVRIEDSTSIRYCYRDMLHRRDGPAFEYKGMEWKEYWLYGELHREDGPAKVNGGGQSWYSHGKLHRDDGPAIEANGIELWFSHGEARQPLSCS